MEAGGPWSLHLVLWEQATIVKPLAGSNMFQRYPSGMRTGIKQRGTSEEIN